MILQGDARERLRELPDGSVHCVISSPPYWSLRDYGLEPVVWGGAADGGCEHDWGEEIVGGEGYENKQGRWNHGYSRDSKPSA